MTDDDAAAAEPDTGALVGGAAFTRDEALRTATHWGVSGLLTREELTAAFDAGTASAAAAPASAAPAAAAPVAAAPAAARPGPTRVGIAEVLSYLGGAVVVIGIATLVGQNWHQLNTGTRLLTTLVAGLAAFGVGVLLGLSPQTRRVAPAFYLIAGLVIPIGVAVLQDSGGQSPGSGTAQSVNALAMLLLFGVAFYLLRRMVLLVLTVVFGTWAFFAVTGLMRDQTPFADPGWLDGTPDFDAYRVLVVGVALGVLGYGLRSTVWTALSGTLYGFGSLGLLGALLVLGGWPPNDSTFWTLAFPVVDLGVLFAGVTLRSRSALTMGTVALMGYLLKLTSAYFSDSLGWPLALVLAGLGMIAIGYGSLVLRRRYLTQVRTV